MYVQVCIIHVYVHVYTYVHVYIHIRNIHTSYVRTCTCMLKVFSSCRAHLYTCISNILYIQPCIGAQFEIFKFAIYGLHTCTYTHTYVSHYGIYSVYSVGEWCYTCIYIRMYMECAKVVHIHGKI